MRGRPGPRPARFPPRFPDIMWLLWLLPGGTSTSKGGHPHQIMDCSRRLELQHRSVNNNNKIFPVLKTEKRGERGRDQTCLPVLLLTHSADTLHPPTISLCTALVDTRWVVDFTPANNKKDSVSEIAISQDLPSDPFRQGRHPSMPPRCGQRADKPSIMTRAQHTKGP